MSEIVIAEAVSDADFRIGRLLFEEYAAALQVDLCFQNFSAELDTLPAMYGAPSGALMIARAADRPVGCVGVRRFREGICEMKRLYVRPSFRGRDIGRQLATTVAARARQLGYSTMVLDTLQSMDAARSLYMSMGFTPADAYYRNPLPDVKYLALDLNLNVRS
jgi:GNAT superfamily N-acetyltransferase